MEEHLTVFNQPHQGNDQVSQYYNKPYILKIIFKLQVWLVVLLELTLPQKKNQMSCHPALQDLIPCFWSNLGFHINEQGGGEERGKLPWRIALIQIGEWFSETQKYTGKFAFSIA